MRLLGPKLLATRYTRPDKVGSIHLSPAYLMDTSRGLWEVVETTPAADARLGVALAPGWILVAAPNSGVFFETRNGEDVFLLAASSVRRIIPWTTNAADVVLASKQILVRTTRRHDEKRGTLIVMRTDDPSGTCSGSVAAVASDVEGIEVGDVVVVSIHAGVETEVGGERLLVVDEASVLALL